MNEHEHVNRAQLTEYDRINYEVYVCMKWKCKIER